ncbi:hypothetical protein [Actinokineospora globicatena]|uniref:SipW-cognate class signal peptide n=1 Tax=Actinokineospora globicatena TaxID=103729 RepID=A0A9W6V5T7_9PSEU|nr:hypothetical protein [Actinokineospora globicatena]GLW90770.1 hypothetical protein Aglo03_15860 [Actinokineospora globicatena]
MTSVRYLAAGTCLAAAGLLATALPAAAAPLPGLSAAYSVSASAVNTTRTLVFTVTNSDILATHGFSFTLTLPLGITRPGAGTSTCVDTTVSDTPPDPGGIVIPPFRTALPADVLYIDGILSGATPSCTITIPVTAAAQGVYPTCAADIADLTGPTTLGSCASIYFEESYAYKGGSAG